MIVVYELSEVRYHEFNFKKKKIIVNQHNTLLYVNILLIAEYFVRVILFCYFFLEILFFILKTNSYIKPIFSLNLADFCILLILTHSLLSILTRARSLEKCTVFLRILYNLVWNRVIMSEKRPWTEEQDRALKIVFQATKVPKWSYIARRLQEDFGVRGRNGKQCKERYTNFINPAYPKEEWCFQQQIKIFQLHNELGNKWAIIGSKLGGKSDNSVKNHFYSRLRKSLRKINKVIQDEFRKQYKQIKPNVLYRVVQASQERFKNNPVFEKQFICFSNSLKTQLLDFSYDGEDQDIEDQVVNVEMAKILIEKMAEFGANYKKKSKKEKRGLCFQQDLLTPHRYQTIQKKCHSENYQESHSFINSSDLPNSEDASEEQINQVVNNNKKNRRNSADTPGSTMEIGRIRTRANSNQNVKKQSAFNQSSEMKDQRQELIKNLAKTDNIQELQIEGILQGLKILQEDQNLPPHPMMMKKQTSKYERYTEGIAQKEDYHFFEDSQIQMRILPEMEMGFNRESQFEQSIFH